MVHWLNHTIKYEGKFNFYRDSRGFFQHFYVHRQMNTTNPVVTALLVQVRYLVIPPALPSYHPYS